MTDKPIDLPLSGVRVVDMIPGALGAIGRLLGELGAEVIRIEPRGGGVDRGQGPMFGGTSLSFAAANLGKRALGIDLRDDRAAVEALVSQADILLEFTAPGSDDSVALDLPGVRASNPTLVILSVSDFGQTGPWASWQASDAVLHALTGGLSRSGLPGREPLLPPGALTIETAAAQAAFVTLAAFVRRLRTGEGDRIDLSLLEAGMHALDPGFGLAGSAQSGVPLWKMARGRHDERHRYPILPCADGYVRLCVLAPRQWRGMFKWMGEPEEFAGREWEHIVTRFRSKTLLPAMTRFFAGKTRDDIEAEGEAHGVPVAALLDLGEAVGTAQMTARGAFVPVEIAPGVAAPFPNGTIEIDGHRAGIRGGVPPIGDPTWREARGTWNAPAAADRPLAGVKVLDMGVIVVGGDTGRLLADQGADVVKVENGAFPDGQRQSRDDAEVSITFAAGHRNKRGLSIDLRSERGKVVFLDLVKQADVLSSNFKPGTLAALGFDRETLERANPRLITVDSSAFGPSGPWSTRLGYGPLVRASAGLAKLWTYEGEPDSFSDAITVYPDHVAARIGAIGVLALLIRRMRTGRGGSASVSQAEVMLGHMATDIAVLGAQAEGHMIAPPADVAEDWLLPCAGDDEWCAVSIRDDVDRAALTTLVGSAARGDVAKWASQRPPGEAMAALQAAGIPAGAMMRVVELPQMPQYAARGTFREISHPLIETRFAVEAAPAPSERLPEPDQRPAPRIGEDSAAVLKDWLGTTEAEATALLADRIIEQAA